MELETNEARVHRQDGPTSSLLHRQRLLAAASAAPASATGATRGDATAGTLLPLALEQFDSSGTLVIHWMDDDTLADMSTSNPNGDGVAFLTADNRFAVETVHFALDWVNFDDDLASCPAGTNPTSMECRAAENMATETATRRSLS